MPARALIQKVASLFRSVQGEGGRPVVRNLAGLLVCTAVSQLCLLGIILLATRHLSLAGMGALVFALTVQALLVHLAGLGTGQVFVRERTAHPERTDELLSAYFLIVSTA